MSARKVAGDSDGMCLTNADCGPQDFVCLHAKTASPSERVVKVTQADGSFFVFAGEISQLWWSSMCVCTCERRFCVHVHACTRAKSFAFFVFAVEIAVVVKYVRLYVLIVCVVFLCEIICAFSCLLAM